jgi:hypothetical protein
MGAITRGKVQLDRKAPGIVRSAMMSGDPWLVLRDLDVDDKTSCVVAVRDVLTGGIVAPSVANAQASSSNSTHPPCSGPAVNVGVAPSSRFRSAWRSPRGHPDRVSGGRPG